MSLIHWWPLSENKNDIVGGAHLSGTYATSGKGKISVGCASEWGTRLSTSDSNLRGLKSFSIAMWVRLDSAANSSAWSDLFGMNMQKGSTTDSLRAEVNATGGNALQLYCNNISGTTGGAANFTLTKDTWQHLVITKEGARLTSYINGSIVNYTDWDTMADAYCTGEFHLSDGGFYCSYNDVRLYNHVLSKKEVKELSRALVFHYTFDGGIGEETTNLLPVTLQNKYVENAADAASYTITSGLGASSYTLFANIKCGILDNSPTPYFSLFADYSDGTTEQLTTYTSLDGTSLRTTKDDQFHPYQLTIENPQRKTVTKLYGWLLDRGSYSGQARYMTVQNAQLEAKDHATAFTSSTRAGQPKNNTGLIHGTMENQGVVFCKDIQRHSVGYFKNGGQQLIYTGLSGYESALTTSMWFKSSNKSPLDGYHILFSIDDGSVEISIPANGQLRYGGYPSSGSRVCDNYSVKVGGQNVNLLDGKWHLINTVFDGTGWLSYVDGEYQTKWTMTSNVKRVSGTLRIGKYTSAATYGATDAYMDDVRLYNTVLSKDDIKQLYESSWAANRQGEVFSSTLNERQEKFQITRSGITNCNILNESGNLPNGYTPLTYIESSGTQFINTNHLATQNTRTIFDYEYLNSSASWAGLFGSDNNPTNNNMGYGLFLNGSTYSCYVSNHTTGGCWNQQVGTWTQNQRTLLDFTHSKLIVDNAAYNLKTTTFATSLVPIYLFAFRRSAGNAGVSSIRLYNCQIWEGTVLVRNFIPVIYHDPQYDEVGLYDTVTGQFYGNAGSGMFTAGPKAVSQSRDGSLYCAEFNEI